jgi:tripartite-type tricarboxylate transporter receptor subunit TctC
LVKGSFPASQPFVLAEPAGTPQTIIDKLSPRVDRILRKPEFVERIAKLGAMPGVRRHADRHTLSPIHGRATRRVSPVG